MDKLILKVITERQMTSCMNNTKWNELVAAITSKKDFDPPVRMKYLLDEEANSGFSPVWWNQIKDDGFELIEWLQIQAFKEEHVGRLVNPKITDHTSFIREALEKNSIPFEFDDGIFTIHGYKSTGG